MANAFREALSRLRDSGISIKAIDIAETLKKLDDANSVEMFYEGARFHEARLKEFGDRLDQPIADLGRQATSARTAVDRGPGARCESASGRAADTAKNLEVAQSNQRRRLLW
jgi:hypothetical protein